MFPALPNFKRGRRLKTRAACTCMIKAVFPTRIYFAPLATAKRIRVLNRELAREARIFRGLDDGGKTWSKENYYGGYTSYASVTDVHRQSPTFRDLERAVDKHVAKYVKALGMDLQGGTLAMSTCWINIMPTGAHHSGHVHPLSVISGTYYVAVPNGSGGIRFEDPRLPMMMAAPPKRQPTPDALRPVIELQPAAGKLVLFESWLRHEVPANRAARERISISFNYEWVV